MRKGEKVFIRQIRKNDAMMILEWENKEEIQNVTNRKFPLSLQMIDALIEEQLDVHNSGQARFIICENNTGIPMGTVDLYEIDFDSGSAFIGIMIVEETNRKKGYAGEAVRLAHEYVRESLDLKQITASIQKENEASVAFFTSLGYVKQEASFGNTNEIIFNRKWV